MIPSDKAKRENQQVLDSAGDILLLADDEIARDLTARIGADRVVRVEDEYDVLTELARRDCSAVLLTAPRREMESLLRAVRRLNNRARLLTIRRPDQKPFKQAGEESMVDGFCMFPPTRGELNQLLQEIGEEKPVERRAISLSVDHVARLIAATQTTESLERQIAEIVSEVIGRDVRWVPAEECPAGAEPLLSLSKPDPRMLVPDGAVTLDESQDAAIADLHAILSVLQDTTRRIESLHRLAITDHLTGAYNRRYFYHLADHVLRHAFERGFRATLLLYDIDNFKHYNDKYGHAAGDEILRDTAMLIRRISREQDIVARIGGDEFAVLFWDHELRSPDSQPLRDVWALSDRFRQAVETLELRSLGPQAIGSLTISGGLAGCPEHGTTCLELMRKADQALRAAKASGKNSIHLIGQE